MQAEQILNLDLRFDPDGAPHPLHANIVNWPDSQEVRQMKAVSLARICAVNSKMILLFGRAMQMRNVAKKPSM
jgi:hypothetical protein